MRESALSAGAVGDRLWLRVADAIDKPILFRWQVEAYRAHIEALWGWDARWQERDFNKLFAALPPLVIMQRGADAVGYIQSQRRAQSLHLANIVLRAEMRGQGIGTRMLGHLQSRASADGIAVTLKVFRSNKRALAFYRGLGFEETSRSNTHFELRWLPGSLAKRL